MISREDAESNARLVSALFESTGDVQAALNELADTEIPSHMKLEYDEDGAPKLLRFVYVDEVECIGCTYCAQVARNTVSTEESSAIDQAPTSPSF